MSGSGKISQLLLALVVTFFVWVVHTLSLEYTAPLQFSVRVSSEMVGYEASSVSNEPLLLRATATGYRLMRLRGVGRGNVTLDLALNPRQIEKADGSDTFFTVRVPEIKDKIIEALGDNVSVDFIETDSLTFFFRRQGYKKVPVVVSSSITYRSQYMPVRKLTLAPDSVLVYGGVAELDGVREVHTSTIYHRSVDKNIQGYVDLECPSGLLRLSQDKVLYTINVERYVEVKKPVEIRTKNLPEGKSLILYPAKVDVTYRFPFDNGRSSCPEIGLYVDYEDCAAAVGTKVIPQLMETDTMILSWEMNPRMVEFIISDEKE